MRTPPGGESQREGVVMAKGAHPNAEVARWPAGSITRYAWANCLVREVDADDFEGRRTERARRRA